MDDDFSEYDEESLVDYILEQVVRETDRDTLLKICALLNKPKD